MIDFEKIPQHVITILKRIREKGGSAYLVGGCVRDLILERESSDWDIATDLKPLVVQKIFPESFYENKFGTVGVKNEEEIIEITTFRKEQGYKDFRHPDKIFFSKKITEDLKRRDFTINALAIEFIEKNKFELLDPFNGQEDLEKKTIKTVGSPEQRFKEDALRLMRAIRLSSQLEFKIDTETLFAIKKYAFLLEKISPERIRDELIKIINTKKPDYGIDLLQKTGLLKIILPEMEKGVGVKQNLHHIHTVYKHSLLSLKYCPSKKLTVRLAALLHDVAKPQTKRGEGANSTFYNHDFIGAKIAGRALDRLRFPKKIREKIILLIKNHMFYYEVDTVTPASIRRLIKKVGLENIKDLIDLRIADRLGSGCPKAKPYKLRHLEYLIEKVSKDPISVKKLKINGDDLFKKAKIEKGPKMGAILEVLLSEVLENPQNNNAPYLIKKAQELNKKELEFLREKARGEIETKKTEEDQVLKKKYWVQ